MWTLSASGVLAVGPNDASKLPFFYVLIAFLAGFSERWAQDMLGRGADEIARPLNGAKQQRNDAKRESKGGKS